MWIHIWRKLICPWEVIRTNGPEYVVRWLRETIANTLAHEVDESITLQGERVFDPHRPLVAKRPDHYQHPYLGDVTPKPPALSPVIAAERWGVFCVEADSWIPDLRVAFQGEAWWSYVRADADTFAEQCRDSEAARRTGYHYEVRKLTRHKT